jgi:hypothetical protein
VEDIMPQGRLAGLLASGYTITYAEDTVIGEGWFADLRDQLGRVRESGGGHTQAAALEHLAGRVERDPAPESAPQPPAAGQLDRVLGPLLAAAYEVTLTSGGPVDDDEFWAHVRLGGGPLLTAAGRTPAEAVWAASPLHGDDEPFPGGLPVPGLADDVRTLSAEMSDVMERLDDIEGDRRDMTILIRALGDLFTRAYPDGFVAKRGDKPGVSLDPQEMKEEMRAVVGGIVEGVAEHPEDDQAAVRLMAGHVADTPSPLPAPCGSYSAAEPYGPCTTCGRAREAHRLAAKSA